MALGADSYSANRTGSKFSIDDGGFNLRGISPEIVHTAMPAIEDYVTGIETILNKISSTTSGEIHTALKGTYQQKTVNAYIENVVVQVKSVADYMRDFKNALEIIKNNYIAQDKSVTNNADVADAKTATGYKDSQTITGVKPFGE